MKERGFTLIELLIVMTILGILLAVGLPSFGNAYLTNRLASYSNNFLGSVQFARSEAIKRNVAVTVCPSSDGAACTSSPSSWQPGWIVKCEAASSTATTCTSGGSSTLVLQKQDALASSYSMTSTSGGYAINLSPSGVGTTDFTLKLCHAVGEQWREIKVTPTGRTSISSKTSASACP
jgi:type IV fimbrial biogenesis protein FimT